ncbi:MAG: helicase-associated domain-containing protein [Anaerolineae bacterium]
MHNLHRFLVDYNLSMLRALARNRGAELATNRQTEAADELAALLLDPVSVRTARAKLSPEAREALDLLQSAGGRMRAPLFSRRFGQVRPVGPGRLEREALWQEPTNPAEELWYAGLIFRAFGQDEAGPGEFIFLPEDLRALLPEPQIEPPAFAVEAVPSPSHSAGDEMALVRDLFAYLVYLQNHDVRPYADGRLGQRDLAALRRGMDDSGERRFAFLQHLARRMGFLERQGEFLRLDAAPVKRWLTAAPDRQLAALQECWRDDPTWNDLCRVPSLACSQETPWANDPVATRQALLALLARCPIEGWWSMASFVAAVKEAHPDFQRPDGDYTSWYIRDAASGDYLSGFDSWNQVEGALIADLLAGPLCWLGIVDTAKEGAVCRLTGAGARFLDLVAGDTVESPTPPIVVLPDFYVEVPPPASLYTRFQLERFADPLPPESGPLRDRAKPEPFRYRLGAGSLTRALSRGIQVEQVLAFLQQAGERPVPANVAGQLRLWAGRFGQVELEEVALLRVKSERVLKELSVLPETRHLLAKILSPTSALIRKRDLARLRKELRGLGYLLPEEPGSDSAGPG